MALTERDEELQLQSTLNRQLKQSLDEATKTPEQRDVSASDYLQQRKSINNSKSKQQESPGKQEFEDYDNQYGTEDQVNINADNNN